MAILWRTTDVRSRRFNDDQPRGPDGKFGSGGAGSSHTDSHAAAHAAGLDYSTAQASTIAAAGKSSWDRLKKLGANVGHVEHVAKQWVTDKCSVGYNKLPGALKPIARGAFAVGRLGTAAAFAVYTAGQSMVEQVCRERGMSPEEARRIRGVCATCDILAAKPIMLGLEFTPGGHALMGPIGLTPVASTGYLLYSTAVNPAATIRAAGKLIAKSASKLAGKLTGRSMETRDGDGSDTVNAIADAISAHGGSDWYIALLSSALDQTQNVSDAITVADAAYEEKSDDDSDKDE